MERAWRCCKRNPVVAGLVTAFVIAVVVGLGGVTSQWIRAEGEADRATQLAEEKEEARTAALKQAEENRRLLYISDMNVAMQAWNDANITRVNELLKRHEPNDDQEDLRGFEWYYLWQLCSRSRQAVTIEQPGRPRRIAVSTEKNRLAVGCGNGIVCVWDLNSNLELRRLRTGRNVNVQNIMRGWDRLSVAYSPDGETLAYPSRDYTEIVLYSWDDRKEKSLQKYDSAIMALAFSPDGRFVATGRADGSVKLWDIRLDSDTKLSFPGHEGDVCSVAFSPDGRYLASAGMDQSIILRDVKTGKVADPLKGQGG